MSSKNFSVVRVTQNCISPTLECFYCKTTIGAMQKVVIIKMNEKKQYLCIDCVDILLGMPKNYTIKVTKEDTKLLSRHICQDTEAHQNQNMTIGTIGSSNGSLKIVTRDRSRELFLNIVRGSDVNLYRAAEEIAFGKKKKVPKKKGSKDDLVIRGYHYNPDIRYERMENGDFRAVQTESGHGRVVRGEDGNLRWTAPTLLVEDPHPDEEPQPQVETNPIEVNPQSLDFTSFVMNGEVVVEASPTPAADFSTGELDRELQDREAQRAAEHENST